jgi:lipopolysaccharide export system protein LptA
MTYRTLIILLITLLLGCGYVIAADLEVPKNRGPVEVSSDKMVADDLAKNLVFEGNAVATQDDVTIYADRLTVTYTGEEREIQQVVAEDSVRIVQGTRVATGDKAVLYHAEERIVLTGTPEVRDGENFVKGDEITLYLNDQRSVVTGGDGGRVNAVFTPKTEE